MATPAIDADAAVGAWYEALLAAARPEAAWTPEALGAAMQWAEQVEALAAREPREGEGEGGPLAAALQRLAPAAPLLCFPCPARARRELLRALLRSLQLTRGCRVAPLLHALEGGGEGSEPTQRYVVGDSSAATLDEMLASVTAAVASLLAPPRAAASADAAAAYFAARAAAPACAACAAPEPHAPGGHLWEPEACSAAACAAALLRREPDGAWRAALDALPAAAAAEACCLRLALAASPAGEDDADADAAGDADADAVAVSDADDDDWGAADEDAWLAPCDAVGAYALRRLALSAASAAPVDAAAPPAPWRAVPPWLLALACGAHRPLCDAYVAALLQPTYASSPDDVAAARDARRDAAARLRCVLAAGGRGAAAARRALAAWGCLWSPPPPKRRRSEDAADARETGA